MRDKEKYNAYLKTYMLKRYRERRDYAVQYLGGKCVRCGTSQLKFLAELEIAQLLCDSCHNAKSITEKGWQRVKNQNVHGTISSYKYCKCVLCKEAKSIYNKNARIKRRK